MWELIEWKLVVSGVIGGVLTVSGQLVVERAKTRNQRKLDKGRIKLLRKMLDKDEKGWRPMDTLSRAIGANEEETARLLIEIGARGSDLDDGKNVWGYIKHNPL